MSETIEEADPLKSLQEWEKIFSGMDFPVLDETLQSLAALSADMGEVSGSQISGTVLPDPLMTLKVMRMANSGRSSRFAQPVTTIEHAVMMVGITVSFNKMLKAVPLSKALSQPARSGLLRVMARALHAADQARDWAVQRLDLNVDEVYIAALLQELGEMVLWVRVPDDMQALEKRRREGGRETAEQQLIGFGCDELALALCQQWSLPPLIGSAFDPAACEAHPRSRLVALARNLARLVEWGWYDEGLNPLIDQVAEILRLQPDDVMARVHRTAADSARNHAVAGVAPAAAWLPMLPGPWPDESEQKAPQVAPKAVAHDDSLQAVLDEIGRHLDGTLTLHELMQIVLRGMRKIGLERVVFALTTPDKSELRAKYIVGADEGAALKRFGFRLSEPYLFGRILARQQAFWLNDASRPKVASMLDPAMNDLLEKEYFIMSAAVNGRVVGLFYADRGNTRKPLDAAGYESFKALCTRAAEAMAHLAKS